MSKPKILKVIIAGGRDFSEYDLLKIFADKILVNQPLVEIISGTCNGADMLGERYAKEKGFELKLFPPDWQKHGKAAGPIRNRRMAEYADALIAFWDGKSSGTKNMIDEAAARNLKVRVCNYTVTGKK